LPLADPTDIVDRMTHRLLLRVCSLLLMPSLAPAAPLRADDLPSPVEMAAAREDSWAEAAIRQPGGPSYEFFRDLLPPLRYVNADFRVYPIVLAAPSSPPNAKARWIADGSAINPRAHQRPMWREIGTPVHFLVGEPGMDFGDDPAMLDGPRYAEGFLPIVQIAYKRGNVSYEQEAFVPASGDLADHGAALVRFSVRGGQGTVAAQLDPDLPVRLGGGTLVDARFRAILLHDGHWTWDEASHELRAKLSPGESAVLVVPTIPMDRAIGTSLAFFDSQRRACADAWKALLERGMTLQIPEPIVQDAWRSLVVAQYLIAAGNLMNYSVGNAYDHLYEAECGDALRSLLLLGHVDTARGMLGPLLAFQRQATRVHVAGHKLQLLAHYYRTTRDAETVRRHEDLWGPALDFILKGREAESGLMPPDNYAGDIPQQVYALSSNANCWRGLRDMAHVLEDMEQHDRAAELRREAETYRSAILNAVEKSEQREVDPPFIPNALFSVEKAYDVTTATRLGSYYDLMAPYVLGSGVFGPGSERETWMIEYLRRHGGLAMGMIRSQSHQGPFVGEPGVNVLYGLRYVQTLLRRDDVPHALAGFYGQLAQAMTRETFVGGEGSKFFHGDRWGRSFYLPPNSASNATFLIVLRDLLVQDWDLDDDGRPETLRLLYGCPGKWLREGAVIDVGRAPTAFGPVSVRAESKLGEGNVTLTIEAPPRRSEKWSVRPALPPGWKVVGARSGEAGLPVAADGAIDLTGQGGRFNVRVEVSR
jgi:hypothetical protein